MPTIMPNFKKWREDLQIGVAQGLQRAHHRALLLGQAAEQHVQHQRRHRQKHARRDDGETPQPLISWLRNLFDGWSSSGVVVKTP